MPTDSKSAAKQIPKPRPHRFQPGNPGGPGRPKGKPNKVTYDVRKMVLAALEGAGGLDYLIQQAKDHPKAFLSLVSRCIPANVQLEVDAKGLLERIVSASMPKSIDADVKRLDETRDGRRLPPPASAS